MFKRIAPLLLFFLLGCGLLGWWVSQWPDPIPVQTQSQDALWKTITKTDKGWSVTSFQPNSSAFVSYQQGAILLYGLGPIPSVSDGEFPSISIPDGGQWIIRTLQPEMRLQIKTSFINGVIVGEGTLFIDSKAKSTINFDAEFTMQNGDLLLPSFLLMPDRQVFFDIADQKDVIPPDLWLLYTTFLRRDQARVLGSATKKDIDTLIQALLAREPESSEGVLHHDLRVRNSLEEISTLANKIEKGDPCGPDVASCFTLLDEIMDKNSALFPEVFLPLNKSIQSWIQLNSETRKNIFTWKNIFHTYHDDILAHDPLARVIRDRSILEMVSSGNTNSQYEIWQYLTRMLADQKLGSVYSLQIMREMIRVGESLMSEKETSDVVRTNLKKTAVESLRNLRNLLETTYFIKKDYWFVLRDDLIDGEGKAIQGETFTKDLQGLITEVDKSTLFDRGAALSDIGVIRSQLAWFNCIFSRNNEYIANPRVCRITVEQ